MRGGGALTKTLSHFTGAKSSCCAAVRTANEQKLLKSRAEPRCQRLEAAAFSSAWFQSRRFHHWQKTYFQWKKLLFVGWQVEIQIKCWIFFLGVAANVTFNFQNSIQLLLCAPALHPETVTPSHSRSSWMSTLHRVQGRFSWHTGRMFQVPPLPSAGTVGMQRRIRKKSHISNHTCDF